MRHIKFTLAIAIAVTACHESADNRSAGAEAADSRSAGAEAAATVMYGPTIQGLQMSAKPLQWVVPAEGPLWVEITVRNVADSIVRFLPIFNIGGLMDAEIIGPTGLPVPKTAEVDPPNAWPVTLFSGELFSDMMDLRCDVPEPTRTMCLAPYDLSQPGEYNVKLRFTLPCDRGPGPCGNAVTIEAEPFTVRVKRRRQER
jgi:hypothetical protein